MDYNNAQITIGKVRTYDSSTGEIVSKEGTYIFTQEGISDGENIKVDDMVLFRGEEVQNMNVAYFIKKLNPAKNIDEQIYRKTRNSKYNKGNE